MAKAKLRSGASEEIESVARALENYARRGIFRGFSGGPSRAGTARFRLVWHFDREFELVLDPGRRSLRFPLLLPSLPSGMDSELRSFIRQRQTDDLPEHRRIDPRRADVRIRNRAGDISLTITALDGDLDYATGKLIHLVHEIFVALLREGSFFDYAVETFGLNPEGM